MRRSVGPWFHKAKNAWFVWHEGRQKNLFVKGEGNETEAQRAWHRLMAGLPVQADPEAVQPAPKPSKRQAEGLPCKAKAGQEADETLPELVKAFLADAEARVKAGCLRNYRTFLLPFSEAFKKDAPESITPAQVERFSKKPGWSQSYRCGFVGAVISLFKWAVEKGKLNQNPVQGVKKPAKQSRGRKALISADDHAELVKHAKGDFGAFLQLLWLTGCRPGEVSGLEAKDVDLTNRVIVLTAHKTAEQTGRDRLIVLSDEAVGILAGLIAKRPEGLLFTGQNGRLTAQAIGRKMARLCEKAGVRSSMAYGYRHTFATDALASGVPDTHVAALLGPGSTVMLHKHYSHVSSRTGVLREALGNVRG